MNMVVYLLFNYQNNCRNKFGGLMTRSTDCEVFIHLCLDGKFDYKFI